MGYFYLMESDKNKKKTKTYKSKPVNNNTDKNTNVPSNTPKLLKNKDNLKKQEDEQMKIDSDGESYEDYLSESDDGNDDEIMGSNDDDFLDKSEDFEEQENEEEPAEKDKKIKVESWDEENKMQDDEKLDFDNEAYEMLHI